LVGGFEWQLSHRTFTMASTSAGSVPVAGRVEQLGPESGAPEDDEEDEQATAMAKSGTRVRHHVAARRR
jgi:hypothetical protein